MSRAIRAAGILATLVAAATTVAAQAPPDVDTLLARVGERIADYYQRAQNIICTETATVQAVGRDYSPQGWARVTEYELRVEADPDSESAEAKVVRQLRRVNGKPPRDKDKKDRAGCTDANPLSSEPLAFLLPAHRAEYTFASAGFGKGKESRSLILEFTSRKGDGKGELIADPRGHQDCFTFSLPVAMKGRVWINAETYQVLRVEQRMAGMADLKVAAPLQRKHNLDTSVTVERHDTVIRYKVIPFSDPDERMLLPESIDTLMMMRGGLESIRSRQAFTDYRRFLTAGRVIK